MTKKVLSLVFIFFCCGSQESLNNNSTVLQSGIEMNESSTSTSTTTFAPFSTTFTQTITIPTTTTSTTVYIAIQPPEAPVTTASGPIPTLSTTTTVPQTATTTTVPQTATTTTVPQAATTTTTSTTTVPQTTIDVVVTVGVGGSGQSVYLLNGSQNTILNVVSGNKYRFDQSDNSNSNHPLRFSTSSEGSQYSTNVTTSGIPGNSGSYVEIEITSNTPNKLYVICTNHFGMGGNLEINKN